MVVVELKEIVFTVQCDCGKSFRAEDFEPRCPYCNRKYVVEMDGDSKQVRLKSNLFKHLRK